jgi:ATP adenylyltransferase
MQQTVRAIELLKRAISPQGFNIGINLGRCAGAGVPGHVHQHVVPRWGGDTNFMSVVGEVRVVPEALSQLYDELMAVLGKM